MNETLFKIHNVDIDAVGLGDFGKRGKSPTPLNPYRTPILDGNLHNEQTEKKVVFSVYAIHLLSIITYKEKLRARLNKEPHMVSNRKTELLRILKVGSRHSALFM